MRNIIMAALVAAALPILILDRAPEPFHPDGWKEPALVASPAATATDEAADRLNVSPGCVRAIAWVARQPSHQVAWDLMDMDTTPGPAACAHLARAYAEHHPAGVDPAAFAALVETEVSKYGHH